MFQVSVGLEDPNDLIADALQALESVLRTQSAAGPEEAGVTSTN